MEQIIQTSLPILYWLLIILLMGIGLAGCVIPMLPGHPLILASVIIAELMIPGFHLEWYHWVLLSLLCLLGMFGDNLFSLWGARRFGSTTAGLWGCLAGALIGCLFFPWGLILGPFIGAVTAELAVSRQQLHEAFVSGFGAFLGTLAGFIFKIIVGLAMILYATTLLIAKLMF